MLLLLPDGGLVIVERYWSSALVIKILNFQVDLVKCGRVANPHRHSHCFTSGEDSHTSLVSDEHFQAVAHFKVLAVVAGS